MNNKLLTLPDIVNMFNISLMTLVRQISKHKIKPSNVKGKVKYYSLSSLGKVELKGDFTIGILVNQLKVGRSLQDINNKTYGYSLTSLKLIYYNILKHLKETGKISIREFKESGNCKKCVWSTKMTNRIYYCMFTKCMKEELKW